MGLHSPVAAHPLDPTPPKVLYLLALLWHFYWASTVSAPGDWDPAYYLSVARHIAAGEGAVTDAVWNLAWLPPDLRHPADLHWMPLPSRVLVPFVSLAPRNPWPATQLCACLLAAGWAPLAWFWAARLDASTAIRWCAGLIAVSAGGYVRTVTTPDSIALYGLLGGAAFLAASQRMAVTLALVAAVAVTRGDGFLLGIAAALAWPGRRGWPVALAGIGAFAAWSMRCWIIGGEGWLAMRARVAGSLRLSELLTTNAPGAPTIGERFLFAGQHVPSMLTVAFIVSGGVLIWPALLEWVKRRHDRGLWPLLAYVLGFPVIIHLLAPAIAAEGSVYRSGAALFVPMCALGAVGAANLTKRYHPWFLPGTLVVAAFVSSALMGRKYEEVRLPGLADCEALSMVPKGEPVLSYDPVGVEARCGYPGAIMARGADLAPLVEQYGFTWALAAPADFDNGTVRAAEFPLAGWTRVGERVFRRE